MAVRLVVFHTALSEIAVNPAAVSYITPDGSAMDSATRIWLIGEPRDPFLVFHGFEEVMTMLMEDPDAS